MSETADEARFALLEEGANGFTQGLVGVHGRLRLDAGTSPVGVLEIDDGAVRFHRGDGEADAVAICDGLDTALAISRGRLNPVVATLQSRLELSGDRSFAVRAILGLAGASTLDARRESSPGGAP